MLDKRLLISPLSLSPLLPLVKLGRSDDKFITGQEFLLFFAPQDPCRVHYGEVGVVRQGLRIRIRIIIIIPSVVDSTTTTLAITHLHEKRGEISLKIVYDITLCSESEYLKLDFFPASI